MGKIEEVINKVVDAARDISSLDVVTITGNINLKPHIDESDSLKFQELHKSLMNRMKTETEVTLDVLAFTHLDMDCDSTNFVRANLSAEQAALVNAHNEMVKTAQETRAGIAKMLLDFFKAGFGK